ncbi:MAG: hypothetical protein ACOYOK_05850 [Pseudobdellovibrionaceae bacterium]
MTATISKTYANKSGQFVIEGILLMTVTVSLLIFASRQVRDQQMIAKLVGTPWGKLSGMIEAGVWDAPSAARKKHPNQINRSQSILNRNQ